MLKNLPEMWESWVWSLGQKDALEKEMATHSSILAWRIPLTEEPGELQSLGLQKVGHHWATNTHTHTHTHTQTHGMILRCWCFVRFVWLLLLLLFFPFSLNWMSITGTLCLPYHCILGADNWFSSFCRWEGILFLDGLCQPFVMPWTVALQVSLSVGFYRQKYWSGLPFPTPGNLPYPGIKPVSLVSCIGRQILYPCAIWKSDKPVS